MAEAADVDGAYRHWSRGLDEKFSEEGHAPLDAATRLTQGGFADISFTPKFTFPLDAKYYAIGSCFARNIEAVLRKDGADVLSLDLHLPDSALAKVEYSPSQVMTKFNPHSMETELCRAFDENIPDDYGFIELAPSQVWNPQLQQVGKMPYEDQVATARAVRQTVRKVADADVVFFTLGLTET